MKTYKALSVTRFYERFEADLKDLGYNLSSYSKFISGMVGKNINLTRSKNQNRLPVALAIPYIDTGCFSDDEMYLIAIKVIDYTKDNDDSGVYEVLDNFISELELSNGLKEFQRIKRQAERVIKWF